MAIDSEGVDRRLRQVSEARKLGLSLKKAGEQLRETPLEPYRASESDEKLRPPRRNRSRTRSPSRCWRPSPFRHCS